MARSACTTSILIRVAMAAGGAVLAMIFSFAYIVETNEHRLVKAGYQAGTGRRIRAERAMKAQYAAAARQRSASRLGELVAGAEAGRWRTHPQRLTRWPGTAPGNRTRQRTPAIRTETDDGSHE